MYADAVLQNILKELPQGDQHQDVAAAVELAFLRGTKAALAAVSDASGPSSQEDFLESLLQAVTHGLSISYA